MGRLLLLLLLVGDCRLLMLSLGASSVWAVLAGAVSSRVGNGWDSEASLQAL